MRFDRNQGDTTTIVRSLPDTPQGATVTFLARQVDGDKQMRGDARFFQRHTWGFLPRTPDMSVPGVYRVYWQVTHPDQTVAVLPDGESDFLTIHATS